jgi:hypothetical protein
MFFFSDDFPGGTGERAREGLISLKMRSWGEMQATDNMQLIEYFANGRFGRI